MTEIDPKIATDLDAVKLRKAQEESLAQAAEEKQKADQAAAVEKMAQRWERNMKRAFKGIYAHSSRKKALDAFARQEAKDES